MIHRLAHNHDDMHGLPQVNLIPQQITAGGASARPEKNVDDTGK